MEKTRLEAFSDGVLAIVITIMVLEAEDWKGKASLVLYLIAILVASGPGRSPTPLACASRSCGSSPIGKRGAIGRARPHG